MAERPPGRHPSYSYKSVKCNFSDSDDDEDENEKAEKEDFGDKNDDEKIKLLKRQSPEFFPLLQELKIYKSELDDTLKPLKKILGEKGTVYQREIQ